MNRMAGTRRWKQQPRRILLCDVIAIAVFTVVIIVTLLALCALTWIVS